MLSDTRNQMISIAAVLVLAACAGSTLNTYDAEFEKLYSAKSESLQNNDDAAALAADFDLLDLSKRARAAGDEAGSGDWKTAVAFYRIAALSAWQAGESGEDQILPITNTGKELCKDKMTEAPRDCILMLIIGPLAVHDDLARDLAPIQVRSEQVVAGSVEELSADDLDKLVEVFEGVKIQFDKISDVRSGAAAGAAPSSLGRYMNNQRVLLFCTAKAARDTMVLAPSHGGNQKVAETKDDFMNMKGRIETEIGPFECPTA